MENKKKGTIIIVAEDDPDDRLLIQDALREANFSNKVQFVEDGASLMDYLHCKGKYSGQSQSESPQLILLDLNMPVKDGWQVLKEIKHDERLKSIPVIVLTTSNNRADIHRSYILGGNGFITKPNTFSKLVEIMKTLESYWFDTVELP